MSKRCQVVCDTAQGIRECELELPNDATIAAALEAARPLLGEQAVDFRSVTTGVFGVVRERQFVPADGDRIEVYRALLIDPRRSRRERAAKAAAQRKR
jgi:putative ubiquitin-RnfH superfamily antitoxin RatB of RatAB toxin-antitoxin module